MSARCPRSGARPPPAFRRPCQAGSSGCALLTASARPCLSPWSLCLPPPTTPVPPWAPDMLPPPPAALADPRVAHSLKNLHSPPRLWKERINHAEDQHLLLQERSFQNPAGAKKASENAASLSLSHLCPRVGRWMYFPGDMNPCRPARSWWRPWGRPVWPPKAPAQAPLFLLR